MQTAQKSRKLCHNTAYAPLVSARLACGLRVAMRFLAKTCFKIALLLLNGGGAAAGKNYNRRIWAIYMSRHQQMQPEMRGAAAEMADELQFISAERHSRRVRALKIILPVLAVIAALVFFWFTFWAAPKGGKIVSQNIEQSEGNKLVMTQPNVEGDTKDGRHYSLNADKAIQDPAKRGLIELRNISGSLPFGSRGNADITAAGAFYDTINNQLRFDQPFTIITADGVSLHFLSASANLQAGLMDSPGRVEISDATRDLTAGGMFVRDNGRVLHFTGRVHIILNKNGAPDGESGQ